jgi:predicted transposase/invertase (TIGR01784 family)
MTIQNPHDHFFRDSFGRAEVARNYLEEYLPAPLRQQLDLTEMVLEDGSFIDEEMQIHQTDLVYRTRWRSGQPIFVYFLFEHKSSPEQLVAYQLLRYQVRLWERQVKAKEPLYPVIPLVIYHGSRPWNIPTDFASVLKLGADGAVLQPYIPNFTYLLGDFSHLAEEEIRGQVWLRVSLSVLRAIFNPSLRSELPELLDLILQLQQQHTGVEYIRTIMRYLTKTHDKITRQEWQEALLQQGEKGEKLMYTIADDYIAEGWQKGLREGRQEGRQEGMREGILELLWVRFSLPADEDLVEGLEQITDIERLRELMRVAATAVEFAQFHQALHTPPNPTPTETTNSI